MKNVVIRSSILLAIVLCVLGLNLATAKPTFANPGLNYIGPRMANTPDEVIGTKCVQDALNIPIDGQFGQQTYDAVKAFQEAHELSVDGIVGPNTGDQLIGYSHSIYYCAKYVPTSYMLMADDGQLAEGGKVTNPQTVLDPGAVVPIGGSVEHCLAQGVTASLSVGGIVKVLWKHKLDLDPIVAAGDAVACILF